MIKVAVVGLGRMGGLYPAIEKVKHRNHIDAIMARDDMKVVMLVDRDVDRLKKTLDTRPELGTVEYHSSIINLPIGELDVIVLCTPPDNRLQDIEIALSKKPRLLIVEKPVALDTETAYKIYELAYEAGIILRVNFHRRFDEQHLKVKNLLSDNPEKVIMRYNKGLFNYASHLVDLIQDWFGLIDSVLCIDSNSKENPSFICRLNAGFEAIFIGIDSLDYDQFEIDIFLKNKRLILENGGCQKIIQSPIDGLFYPNYIQLGQRDYISEPGPFSGLSELYNAVYNYLTNDVEMPGCTAYEAYKGLSVLDAVIESRNSGLREIPRIFE